MPRDHVDKKREGRKEGREGGSGREGKASRQALP